MSASSKPFGSKTGPDDMSDTLREALDFVEQMNSDGLTAVPLKPTMPMLLAGAKAGSVTVETACRMYQAMLAALD